MKTFENAEVGDRVWDIGLGWGTISNIKDMDYPLLVSFPNFGDHSYMIDGKAYDSDLNPRLFWDEVKIEIPSKPLPKLEVDTPVWVWGANKNLKVLRAFSHFNENMEICIFIDGYSSLGEGGGEYVPWKNWELACKDNK